MGRTCSTRRNDENSFKIFVELLKGRYPVRDLVADGRITLKWILNK